MKTNEKISFKLLKAFIQPIIAVFFLFVSSSIVAQTRIQSATGNTGTNAVTSFTVTLGSAPTNGNTLIAVISGRTATANNISSISQTGATWTRAVSVANTVTSNTEIWYTTALSGAGTTITINQGSTRAAAVVMEYNGVLYSTPLDQTASYANPTNSTSASTGTTSTTTLGTELWIGAVGLRSSGFTLSSITNGFSTVTNAFSTNATAGNNARIYALEKIVTSTGAATTGGTVSTSSLWTGAIATFKSSLLSNFTPAASCKGGGATVTVNGLGFTGSSVVSFNGILASTTFVNATQLTAVLPNNATSGFISVTTGTNTVTSTNPFLVKSPPVPTANITNTTCPTSSDGAVSPNNIPTALNFDFTKSQYVNLGTSLLNNLSAFTIEGWIKTTTYNRNSFFGQDNAIEIGFAANGTIELWSEGLTTNVYTPTAFPTDGEWHHIAGTGNGNNMTIYIDGVQVVTSVHATTTNYGSSDRTTKIGGFVWDNATPNYFNGQMLKVGFWNRALSHAKIIELASTPYGYYSGETGLIAGYNFFEGTGTSLSSIPTGNSGTITGSPVSTWSDLFTYSWSRVSGGFSATTKNISGLPMGTYNLAATFNGCTSNSGNLDVGTNGKESSIVGVSILGTSPVCTGTEVTLSLAGVTGASLGTNAQWKWYSGSCGGTSEGTGNSISVNPATTTTYYVRAEGTCNTTACVYYTVVVNAAGTWLGYNSNWFDAQNWCGTVPTSSTDVIIPTTLETNRVYPIINANSAVCKSLTIQTGASVNMGGAYTFDMYGNWVNNGTFTPATSTVTFKANGTVSGTATTTFHHLTIDTDKTLTGSSATMNIAGNWTNNGSFTNNSGTVVFNGTSMQEINGITTFNNLTINNNAGVVGKSNLTVNAVLNLASDSPDETKGSLEMTNLYGDYSNIATPVDSLTKHKTQSWDILNSNILYMGASATTIGIGDVTGKVKRTTIANGTEYSFGNPNSTITFNINSTGTLPSNVMFVITKGSVRGIHSNKTSTVQRLYQVIRTGGELPTSFSLKLHYKDSELNGNMESKLVLWDHHIPYSNTNTPHEHGKTVQDSVNNFVSLSGHGINYLGSEEVVGGFTKYWMFNNTNISNNQWLGAASTEWKNRSNWTKGWYPKSTDIVEIPQTTNDPILPTDTVAVARSIIIMEGGVLNGGTGTLKISGGIATNGGPGSWTNAGTFVAGTSTVEFDFPRVDSVKTSTIAGTTDFYNITIANNTYLVLQDGANVAVGGTITQTGYLDARTYENSFEYNGEDAQTIINPALGNGYHNLILSGDGTKTLPASSLNIAGNLVLDADFSATSDTIVFDGASAQILSGSSTSVLNNLTLNNASGLTLWKNQTVDGTLTLTNGLINAESNVLTVTCDGTISGQAETRYINGKLAREFCEASSKAYPIGKDGVYRPLTLEYTTLSGSSSTVQAQQLETVIPGSIFPNNTTYQTERYWHLTETDGDGNGYYLLTLNGDPFTTNVTAKILRGDGTTNTSIAASFSTPNFSSVSVTDNTFGNFAVASECLPPTIISHPAADPICELTGTAEFTVTPAEGYTYTWEVQTEAEGAWTTVSDGGVYSNATTSTLTITEPPFSMNTYSYHALVARNCGGTATSNPATLTVNLQPQGSLSGETDICKGSTGHLTWTATAGTGPFTVVYYDGTSNHTANDVDSGEAFSVGSISANTTFTLISVTDVNCTRISGFTTGSAEITVDPYITWTGATDTDWNTASNWCGGIPTASDNVLIPNVTNKPVISNTPTATTLSLIIESGSSVTINSVYTLKVNGDLTNNGTLTAADGTLDITGFIENNGIINTKNTIPIRTSYGGTVVFNGTSIQTLNGGTYNDIVVDNPSGVVMAADAVVVANGTLEVKSNAKLEIGTNRSVSANSVVNNAGTSGIVIKAASGVPNGSLLFDNPLEEPVQATVQMYSPAYWVYRESAVTPGKFVYDYYWQFMGIPLKNMGSLDQNLYGAIVRRYNEPGWGTASATPLLNRRWIQLQNSNTMSPVTGYEMVQLAPTTYAFPGELYNGDIDTTLSYTPYVLNTRGQYPGQHILSNPYTAAIRISDIIFGHNMDSAVYIYNTGSYSQWSAGNTTFASAPGQYISATLQTAGKGDIPGEIPSMQGFLVRTNREAAGSIYINYNNVKTRNTSTQRAPKKRTWMKISLVGANSGDVMWLFSHPETTRGVDNGWDALKFAGASGTPMIYASEADGVYQINAVPDIHETKLGFRAGTMDFDYKLVFNNENMQNDYSNVYLYDINTGDILNITENGTEYLFSSSNTGYEDRFKILTSLPEATDFEHKSVNDLRVFNSGQQLFVENKTTEQASIFVLDALGRLAQSYTVKAGELSTTTLNLPTGSYIVRYVTDNISHSKQLIIK